MAKRPKLSIGVHAAFDPVADGDALKAASLRRAVAAQMGRELKPGDDPGPVSTSDPQARTAIEALYGKQFGAPALQSMQAKFAQANPAPPPADAAGRLVSRVASLFKSTPPPLSPEELAQLKGGDLHARLLERLHTVQAISDELMTIIMSIGHTLARLNGAYAAGSRRSRPNSANKSAAVIIERIIRIFGIEACTLT